MAGDNRGPVQSHHARAVAASLAGWPQPSSTTKADAGIAPRAARAAVAAVARARGVTTVGFTGEKGRQSMAPKCDLCLVVPSADTPRVQEVHEFVWHGTDPKNPTHKVLGALALAALINHARKQAALHMMARGAR